MGAGEAEVFAKEIAEAILKRPLDIDMEDLRAYELTLADGSNFIVVSKVVPGIRAVVAKNTQSNGEVTPCFWRTRVPYFQEVRADAVISVREVLPMEMADYLEEIEESEGAG